MDNQEFGDALALIFDPVRGNMLTTRSVLHGIGFRRIEGVTSFEALERRLKDSDVCVLFIESTDNVTEVAELLQSIRVGSRKCNPFLPIISTLWVGNSEDVAALMNVGCDDVLLRPFSVTKTEERIKAIIDNRKRFVVTSDYVGPDRGATNNNDYNIEAFEVPNPLREVVKGITPDPVKRAELMDYATKRVNKERLAKLARRIAIAAEVALQSENKFDTNSGYMLDMLATSYELVRTAKRMEQEDVYDIAIVLENVATKAASGANTHENANLTRQLALAIYVAYASEDGDNFKRELEATLDTVRIRLEKAKERDKKLKEMNTRLDNAENIDDEIANDTAKIAANNIKLDDAIFGVGLSA